MFILSFYLISSVWNWSTSEESSSKDVDSGTWSFVKSIVPPKLNVVLYDSKVGDRGAIDIGIHTDHWLRGFFPLLKLIADVAIFERVGFWENSDDDEFIGAVCKPDEIRNSSENSSFIMYNVNGELFSSIIRTSEEDQGISGEDKISDIFSVWGKIISSVSVVRTVWLIVAGARTRLPLWEIFF